MRRLVVLAVVLVFPLPAPATIWTTVYRCDGVTPLEIVEPNHPVLYRDIMVGTRLVIMVSSDEPGSYYDPNLFGGARVLWGGALYVTPDDADLGQGRLSARGYNPQTKNYDGSWTEWGSLIGAPIEKP